MKSMTFDFIGIGKHEITPKMHLSSKTSLFPDISSHEELETVTFGLVYHMPFIHIPINEIPDRLSEISRDKIIGIFCSSGVRSTMPFFNLRILGLENVRIIAGNYAELVDEFKPGKLLKYLSSGKGDKSDENCNY